MATITLKHVSKSYDNKVTVIPDLNLEIRDREFLILVGPSGCGKSTTLRMIAGLEDVSGGELLIGDKLVNDVPPKDRDIAMVFQSYALYPHMSVYKNMAFGLKLRKMPKEEIDRKVRDAARILDIEDYLERKPKALSGGQRQRVALGRAMVRQPSVFLLDEPLSNLDAKLRTEMRSQITKLHKDLQTTFVYVTHDQTEAMTMADRIVVMKDGHVLQVDPPHTLYHNPANVFVAGFIGSPRMNLIPARLEQGMGGPAIVFGGCKTDLPEHVAKRLDFEAYRDKDVLLGVRPEDFHMPDEFVAEASTDNVEMYVHLAEMMGSEIYLYSRMDGTEVIAKVPSSAGIRSYDTVKLSVDMARIHLFDKVTEESILVPGDDLAYNKEED